MNKSVHKCSSIEHKEIDAIKYCKECNIYIKTQNKHLTFF